MRKRIFPKPKIKCPFCKAKFWSLQRFYAHLETCDKRKEWKYKRPCWETKLQKEEVKENELRKTEIK